VRVVHTAGLRTALFRARAPYGLIFANILLDPLKALATPMARLVAANGQIVLSGLLAASLTTAGVYAALLLPLGLVGEDERAALSAWCDRLVGGAQAAARSGS